MNVCGAVGHTVYRFLSRTYLEENDTGAIFRRPGNSQAEGRERHTHAAKCVAPLPDGDYSKSVAVFEEVRQFKARNIPLKISKLALNILPILGVSNLSSMIMGI